MQDNIDTKLEWCQKAIDADMAGCQILIANLLQNQLNSFWSSLLAQNSLRNNSVHLQPIKGAITDAYIMVHQ